jgi:hypothetical protein
MPDAYLLSDSDLQKLRKLLGEHGMSKVQHQPLSPLPGSPEVYVAKVKDNPGSIPALKLKDTDDYDHPGCAMCDVYQIMPSSSSEDWDLVPISGLGFPVYNLTTIDIGDDWLLVVRDKSGRWIAAVPTEAKHWGVLDGELAYNGTQDVTLDIGGSIEDVHPPKTMLSGSIASVNGDTPVLIELIDGNWYVTLAPC